MNIRFEPMIMTEQLAIQIAGWYNDPDIAPFIEPTFTESEPHHFTVADIFKQHEPRPGILIYLILDDQFPIGEFSITRDFYWLMGEKENSAWISIAIGEKSYWGKGISKLAMAFIEEECRRLGFTRIELGVFENNVKAKNLYDKMGYVQFAKNEHMTYSQGAWRADLRMQKYL
jgi:RimJ/RimL family protein N-acetyltransferase